MSFVGGEKLIDFGVPLADLYFHQLVLLFSWYSSWYEKKEIPLSYIVVHENIIFSSC